MKKTNDHCPTSLTRRNFLQCATAGLSSLALAWRFTPNILAADEIRLRMDEIKVDVTPKRSAASQTGLDRFASFSDRTGKGKYKVRCRVIGEGKDHIIFLHGSPGSLEDFYDGLSEMIDRKRYKALFLDVPGYRASERPESPDPVVGLMDAETHPDVTSLMNIAFLIRQTIAEEGMQMPVVVAHSWGTIPASFYAAGFEEDLAALVLICPVVMPNPMFDLVPPASAVLRTIKPLASNLSGRVEDGVTFKFDMSKPFRTTIGFGSTVVKMKVDGQIIITTEGGGKKQAIEELLKELSKNGASLLDRIIDHTVKLAFSPADPNEVKPSYLQAIKREMHDISRLRILFIDSDLIINGVVGGLEEVYPGFRIPIIMRAGRKDKLASYRHHMETMQQRLHGLTLIEADMVESGHLMPITHPTAVLSAMTRSFDAIWENGFVKVNGLDVTGKSIEDVKELIWTELTLQRKAFEDASDLPEHQRRTAMRLASLTNNWAYWLFATRGRADSMKLTGSPVGELLKKEMERRETDAAFEFDPIGFSKELKRAWARTALDKTMDYIKTAVNKGVGIREHGALELAPEHRLDSIDLSCLEILCVCARNHWLFLEQEKKSDDAAKWISNAKKALDILNKANKSNSHNFATMYPHQREFIERAVAKKN